MNDAAYFWRVDVKNFVAALFLEHIPKDLAGRHYVGFEELHVQRRHVVQDALAFDLIFHTSRFVLVDSDFTFVARRHDEVKRRPGVVLYDNLGQ